DILPTDELSLEFNNAQDTWVPAGTNTIGSYIVQSSSTYGVGLNRDGGNPRRAYVLFGNMGNHPSNATYGGAGAAWSGATSWKWRVRRRRVVSQTIREKLGL